AYEPHRIVLAVLLVVRVVASGSVTTGHLERELLLVEIGARELETGDAHQHDAPALAAHLRGLMHRLAAFRRRRDEDTIDATAAGERERRIHRLASRPERDHLRPEFSRESKPRRG